MLDTNAKEAQRFGARTSGEVALYDDAGRLAFRGGITAARGHEGDSTGRDAILRWLNHLPADKCSPTFGCPLLAAADTDD
jgi:hypothetical protein